MAARAIAARRKTVAAECRCRLIIVSSRTGRLKRRFIFVQARQV
jgi:hypothetical protein